MMSRRVVPWCCLAVAICLPSVASAGYWLNGKYYTKGVECGITAGGIGNAVKNGVWITCEITPPSASTTIQGFALCENPGGNKPPGLQPSEISVSFGATVLVDQQQVMRNGKAYVPVVTVPPEDVLVPLVVACPNVNYVVTDFIPCAFTAVVTLLDSYGTTVTERHSCSLSQCDTLGFDKKTGLVEKREYTCTQIE